jgi:hypothetical protein
MQTISTLKAAQRFTAEQRDILRNAADIIADHRKAHRQASFISSRGVGWGEPALPVLLEECDTTACFAGWVTAIAHPTMSLDAVGALASERAADILGLTNAEAGSLFLDTSHWSTDDMVMFVLAMADGTPVDNPSWSMMDVADALGVEIA